MKKSYSSIEEINADLEILKVQRDIHYYKITQSLESIKSELTPNNLVRNTFGSVTSFVKGSNNVQAFIISAVMKYFFKKVRKRNTDNL